MRRNIHQPFLAWRAASILTRAHSLYYKAGLRGNRTCCGITIQLEGEVIWWRKTVIVNRYNGESVWEVDRKFLKAIRSGAISTRALHDLILQARAMRTNARNVARQAALTSGNTYAVRIN